jgi:DNA-binding transcriptional LysR family regulator
MNISLRQLRAFLGVAHSGSFTKTAQSLHLSQAALSAAIRGLETQLNIRLFERTTRAVVLTDAGREFLPTATLVENELNAAAVSLRSRERQEISTLRIGITPLIAAAIVPELLLRFAQSHPHIKVETLDDTPSDLQHEVESGALDAAFGAFFTKLSGLRHRTVLSSHLVAVYAPDQEGAPCGTRKASAQMQWEALDERTLICLHQESPIQQLVEEALHQHKLKATRRITVKHLETAVAMAEKNFGMAIIPSFAQSACARYAVECTALTPLVSFDFYCITRTGAVVPPALEDFCTLFEKLVSEKAVPPAYLGKSVSDMTSTTSAPTRTTEPTTTATITPQIAGRYDASKAAQSTPTISVSRVST